MARSRAVRTRRTQAQWNGILRRFATSGLSSREYCRREGVSLSSLQRWRARLAAPSAASGFVELTASSSAPGVEEKWTVELTFPSGVSLRLRG
jgi:Transposase